MRSFLLIAATTVALSTSAIAATETVIWNFPAGSFPLGQVTLEPKTGTLYGTTVDGGNGIGTVFSLREKNGTWAYRLLYAFSGGADGAYPVAGVTEDSSGALYGTTAEGGSSNAGTAFKLTYNGSWVHTVLHTFGGGADGGGPAADLTIDKRTGTLYGTTTYGGGSSSCGIVFALSPSGGETVLYAFQGRPSDGCDPYARVREDANGNLFGVTLFGGLQNCRYYGCGIAYMLAAGSWSESILYGFKGEIQDDGRYPTDVDLDPATGVLYGTTESGGTKNGGIVFELTNTNGSWQEHRLHNFRNGYYGYVGPKFLRVDETTGVLYGSTELGGLQNFGTIFQLTNGGGSWVETTLHTFAGPPGDGRSPTARPTVDPKTGYLYGTTSAGGTYDSGTVYLITP